MPPFKDLSGKKFGRLLVIAFVPTVKYAYYYQCQCDCGKNVTVASGSLTSGATLSCGCYWRDLSEKKFLKIGEKRNRLVFLKELESSYQKNGNRKRYGLFRCDCGSEKRILVYSVTSGCVLSCGCYAKELNRKLVTDRNTTHGLSHHPLYWRWNKIKDRCLNPKSKRYKDYGGRGITICPEWVNNFKVFYDWCLLNGYHPDLDIDRRDNERGYSPDNCRFITNQENANNSRSNIIVYFHGEKLTLAQACQKAGIMQKYILAWRWVKKGKTFEEALNYCL